MFGWEKYDISLNYLLMLFGWETMMLVNRNVINFINHPPNIAPFLWLGFQPSKLRVICDIAIPTLRRIGSNCNVMSPEISCLKSVELAYARYIYSGFPSLYSPTWGARADKIRGFSCEKRGEHLAMLAARWAPHPLCWAVLETYVERIKRAMPSMAQKIPLTRQEIWVPSVKRIT